MLTDDDENLICPITQEYFRDPVRADDGRLYEREAITRWINEHGTSPFTRQVLNVNYLQPDDEVRKRAEQRRRLSVSYNRESNTVRIPPIRSVSNIMPLQQVPNIRQTPRPNDRQNPGRSPKAPYKFNIFCICVTMCMLIGFIVTIAVVASRKSTTSTYPTRYNIPIPPNLCYPLNTSRFKV